MIHESFLIFLHHRQNLEKKSGEVTDIINFNPVFLLHKLHKSTKNLFSPLARRSSEILHLLQPVLQPLKPLNPIPKS